jgi:hypothetical protein
VEVAVGAGVRLGLDVAVGAAVTVGGSGLCVGAAVGAGWQPASRRAKMMTAKDRVFLGEPGKPCLFKHLSENSVRVSNFRTGSESFHLKM